MNVTMRAATDAERLYAAQQSMQIEGQTGGIGCLQVRLGDGQESKWADYRTGLNTEGFQKDSEPVFSAIRESFSQYCTEHPECQTENGTYIVRSDTAQYSYIARMNPAEKERKVSIFCYRRDFLNGHMRCAEQGIRFITSGYQEKFRVRDGGTIRIVANDGKSYENTVRYIDECHLELTSKRTGYTELFHICQLAEILEQNGRTVTPVQGTMPEKSRFKNYEIHRGMER